MNTLVSNTSLSGTLIALDIAKKHHDAKIRHPDGRTSYLRIENTLEGDHHPLHVVILQCRQMIGAEPVLMVK